MKRRLLALLLAMTLALGLTACGGTEYAAEDENTPTQETVQPEEESPDAAPEDGEDNAAPEESEDPAQEPEAETPAEPAAEGVDLAAFYNTLAGGETWPGMMAVEGEALAAFYPGLADIAAKQCLVYYSMISATVGEIALVEVENSADVETVKGIFQARIDYQVGDGENPGGAWYPASIEGWQNGSRIVSHGNYVMLIALAEGADDVVSAFNALFA